MNITFWRDVGWLLRNELRRIGFGYLWSAVLMVYFSLFSGVALIGDIESSNVKDYMKNNGMLDFFFLVALSTMGFAFSRDYLQFWKNNGLSSKIKFYKSLPISTEVIVVCRQITFFIIAVFSGLIFFASLYFVSSYVREIFDLRDYIAFSASWFGYSTIVGSVYLYWELGYKEKTYFALCCLTIILFVSIPLLLLLLDAPMVLSSIRIVKETGFMLSAITLVIGAACHLVLRKLAVRQLDRRNLT